MRIPYSILGRSHVMRRLSRRVGRANLGMIASSVAFFGFLAIFPGIAAIIAIWGFASDPGIIRQEVAMLQDVLPSEAFLLVQGQVESLLAANSRHLGWTTVISTGIALWSARSGVAALITGINAIHHQPGHDIFKHIILASLLTLTLVAIALAALVAAVVAPVAIGLLNLGPSTALVLEIANFGLGLFLVVIGLALAYRYGPNRGVRQTLFSRGVLVAVILWALVSRGFVIYLENFNSYNRVYGSIGAVVVLLMWLYLSAYAVLLGAAIDADRADPDQF